MNSNSFEFLVSILKSIENSGKNDNKIENAIINLIDNFDSSFSYEQKKEILSQFVHYEKKRIGRKDYDKMKAVLEDENYRSLLENFFDCEEVV